MKRKLLFTLLAVGIAFGCFAAITDITGKWTGLLDLGNGGAEITYNLVASGDKLTGSAEALGDKHDIINGKIKGDSLLFDVDYNGESIPHAAKCYADSISVNVSARGQIFHLQLKRAK